MSSWLSMLLCAVSVPGPDAVVVCPPALRPALRPWTEYRQAQGHRLQFLTPADSAAEICAAIRELARSAPLRSVVLVGDVAPAPQTAESAAWHTPTHQVAAVVNVRWGSEAEIATDNPYGDLDGDQVPELAVGRLPARSPEQLALLVTKILAYERADQGAWRRRINLVAGVGGFSPLADSILEMATRKILTDGIPDGFETTMTYASWQSPFCPDPRRFGEVTLERLNEGCLFWVYIGHGQRQQLDQVRLPGSVHPILRGSDLDQLDCAAGLPIALLLACYAGAFDQPQDCLAEGLLRQPAGPVAVISGSRVTMPYAMAVLGSALMEQVFHRQPLTLGEIVCGAKQQMVRPAEETRHRQLLDGVAAAVSPAADQLPAERLEHLALFNLLGDPLLRIGHPQPIELAVPDSIDAGQQLSIRGESPLAGEAFVEVVSRRDRLKHELPPRSRFVPTDEFLSSFDAAYRAANDRVWTRQSFTTAGGAFALELAVPAETRGPCYVRAWIQGRDRSALGAARLFVHRPAQDQLGAE